MSLTVPYVNPSSLGNGPFRGFMPRQFANNARSGASVIDRRVITKSWNNAYAVGTANNRKRVIGPFRAITNSGDFLSRQAYSCGGPNTVNRDKPGRGSAIGAIPQQCDGTGIPPSTCNPKFVADSSDYVRYKRTRAANQTYNDLKMGGNANRGQFVPLMAVRRR